MITMGMITVRMITVRMITVRMITIGMNTIGMNTIGMNTIGMCAGGTDHQSQLVIDLVLTRAARAPVVNVLTDCKAQRMKCVDRAIRSSSEG